MINPQIEQEIVEWKLEKLLVFPIQIYDSHTSCECECEYATYPYMKICFTF